MKPVYKVEVDDHSDDCGTVYLLSGPNVSILDKDEELLKARSEDFNLGFEAGVASVSLDSMLTRQTQENLRLQEKLKEAMELLKRADLPPEASFMKGGYLHQWHQRYEALKKTT